MNIHIDLPEGCDIYVVSWLDTRSRLQIVQYSAFCQFVIAIYPEEALGFIVALPDADDGWHHVKSGMTVWTLRDHLRGFNEQEGSKT